MGTSSEKHLNTFTTLAAESSLNVLAHLF